MFWDDKDLVLAFKIVVLGNTPAMVMVMIYIAITLLPIILIVNNRNHSIVNHLNCEQIVQG